MGSQGLRPPDRPRPRGAPPPAAGRGARGAARPAQDLSRLRLRRRQVVPAVRRGRAGASARRGRRDRRHAAGGRPTACAQVTRDSRSIPTRDGRTGCPSSTSTAVLARRPGVCLVDGLAYDNPPGSRHAKRYEDVEELVERGISVLTSINLEYIAEQQAFVRGVHGRRAGRDGAAGLHRIAPTRSSSSTRRRRPCWRSTTTTASRCRSCSAAVAAPRARAAAHRGRGRSAARGVPRAPRHRVVLGHAGADSRVHDAASQRRRDAGQRPPQRRPVPRRAVRHLRQPAGPDAARTDRDRAQRDAGARAAARTSTSLDGTRPDRRRSSTTPASTASRSSSSGHNLRRRWRTRLSGSPLDRLIRDAEGIDVRVFPHCTWPRTHGARAAEDLPGLRRRRRQDVPDADRGPAS